MSEKRKSKPQLLAEALGTTSEKAKQFGDQVNQYLLHNGHQPETFMKMCEVVRAYPDRKWNARMVAEALYVPHTPPSDSISTDAQIFLRKAPHSANDDQTIASKTVRVRLSDLDETARAQVQKDLSAALNEADKHAPNAQPSMKTASWFKRPTSATGTSHSPIISAYESTTINENTRQEGKQPLLRRTSSFTSLRLRGAGFNKASRVLRAESHAMQPMEYGPEEAKIQQFVRDRGIKYLVHLTTMENLHGICREGAILSVNELKRRNLTYRAFDTSRLDGHLDFINCSIGYHNFHMFYNAVSKTYSHDVILLVQPTYLWQSETRFCPCNAATRGGSYVGSGYEALVGLYQERVNDKVGSQNRANKPEWLPTNIQAEVLVYQQIPIEDIMQVVVRYPGRKDDVTSAGWTGRVTVNEDSFIYRDTWISKTPQQFSTIGLIDF